MTTQLASRLALLAEDWRKRRERPDHEFNDLSAAEKHNLQVECLELINKLDQGFNYLISMCELHNGGDDGNVACGWTICQAGKDGEFPKWSKAIGGVAYPGIDKRERMSPFKQAGDADWCVFAQWDEAKQALDKMDADVRQHFRIYPVVMAAAAEPRTTRPK